MSLTKPDQHFQYHGEVPPYPGTPQVLPIKLVSYCVRLIMFLCSLQTLPLVVFQWRPSQGQVGLPPEKPSNLVLTSSAPVLGGRTMSCCVPSREINILLILSIVLILQGCLFPCTNVWLVYCKETISSSFFSIDNQSFFFHICISIKCFTNLLCLFSLGLWVIVKREYWVCNQNNLCKIIVIF